MSPSIKLLGLVLLAGGCGGTDGGDPPAADKILLQGSDMGPRFQNFTISRAGASVSSAVVSINGVSLTTTANGRYNYDVGRELQPGEVLVVRVAIGSDVVEGRATIIGQATLTAPIQNQLFTFGQNLNFTWTASAEPDFWLVGLSYNLAGAGIGLADSVARTARSRTLSTATIAASATAPVGYLFGYLHGTFTGPADPASTMNVRVSAQEVTLTKAP